MKGVYDRLVLALEEPCGQCGDPAQHLTFGVDDVPPAVGAFRARDKRTHELRDSFVPAPVTAEAGLVHALGPLLGPTPFSVDVTYDRKRQ